MSTERDNQMVWDGRSPGHYEVWYLTFNHRASGTGFWIRYTLESPLPGHGEPYAQLWFARFDAQHPRRNLALNRKLPIAEFGAQASPFELRLGDAVLRHGALTGRLQSGSHEISWDLSFSPASFTHRFFPDLIYDRSFADTKAVSPNLMVALSGQIVVDDRTYTLVDEPGGQSHLWGRKHAHAHAWAHCNAFREDATAGLEVLSAKIRRGGFVSPTLTWMSLYLGSEVYAFRELWSVPLARASWETGLYRFSALGPLARVEGEFRSRPEDLVRATYVDPDGQEAFCHNTEVADAQVTLWTRRSVFSRFRQLCRLTARGTGHFEYVARTPDGRVERQHQTIR